MNNNFISGSAGFIGSHLYKEIGGTGYDNLSVPNARPNGGKFYKADILDIETLRSAMKGHDTVWHLAASGEVGNPKTDVDLKNNTIGTYNVLESMRLNDISKIVFSSSATYYGKKEGECYETTPPSSISLYGASKVAGEALINAYSNLYGIKAWVFRFGNVVGGHMGRGVIHDFIKKLKANPKQLIIIGDGKQKKPYFLVGDCIEGMLCGLQYPPDTYNLAPNTFTTVDEIADIVINIMGLTDVKIIYTPVPAYDVPIVNLNADKIRKLGWQPKYTSNEAVIIATKRLLEELK